MTALAFVEQGAVRVFRTRPPEPLGKLNRARLWRPNVTRTSRTRGANAPPGPGFVCGRCGRTVPGSAPGTDHRNHCPWCLWSRHIDLCMGDRRCSCRGLMEPMAVAVRADGEWMLVHRCTACGFVRTNRIAGDDSELLLVSLALRPLARPPFPLDRIRPDGGVAPVIAEDGP